MKRRTFLARGGVAATATAIAAPAPAQGRIVWNMTMPWPRNTPGVGVNAQRFAERVNRMSNGRLEIRLFAAGELVPPFEGLDAVQSGAADIAHGTPYFWVGKSAALNYFTGVPFGFTAPELAAWLYFGEGMKLWREVYADFGVVPFYAGSSGLQAGGWFKREINRLEDFEGLKFRIAGLGGEVLKRLGATTVLLPPGEIGPALMSGAIDAAEWIGPWNDRAFGLYKVAKYYYVPGFAEPGPGLEVIVNRQRWEALPDDLKAIIETAAAATAGETFADFTYHNMRSFEPLITEEGVELRSFSDEIFDALGRTSFEVLEELAAKDPLTGRIHASFMAFLREATRYTSRFDSVFLRHRARVMSV